MGLRFWKTAPPSSGFALEGIDDRFAEACERLGVARISPLNPSNTGHTRSAAAETADAHRYWLKVYGSTSPDHPPRKGEIASDALSGICKPRLVRQIEWTDGDVLWTARLTTLADDAVEQTPWAGDAAAAATDAWLEELKANLDRLAPQPSERIRISPQQLSAWLSHNYRLHLPPALRVFAVGMGDIPWRPAMEQPYRAQPAYPRLGMARFRAGRIRRRNAYRLFLPQSRARPASQKGILTASLYADRNDCMAFRRS